MTELIESILLDEGPCLTNELCSKLECRGFAPDAARKQVSRANGKVRRLDGFDFPKGVRFVYHESNFNSSKYWARLIREICRSSPAYGPALAAVIARGGIVPAKHFPIISGSPTLQKKQIASAAVLERLIAAKVLKKIDVDGIGTCVAVDASGHLLHAGLAQLKARLITEDVLLLAVSDWARKLNLASYSKIALRNDEPPPVYGTFQWDLSGPSYIRPMMRKQRGGKPKPGFLVCDVICGSALNEDAVSAFVRKAKLLGHFTALGPMMPFLIADGFSREAFRLGRSHGLILTTPEILFGREIAEALSSLLQTLIRAAEVAVKRPEVITELFDKFSRIEGAAANLRGALFEMVMAHAVHDIGGGTIEIGKRVHDGAGGRAEIDVIRVRERKEVWLYEAKGHQPTEVVSPKAVEDWVTRKIPLIHRILRTDPHYQGCSFYFEYWTCGTFSAEARGDLDAASERTGKRQPFKVCRGRIVGALGTLTGAGRAGLKGCCIVPATRRRPESRDDGESAGEDEGNGRRQRAKPLLPLCRDNRGRQAYRRPQAAGEADRRPCVGSDRIGPAFGEAVAYGNCDGTASQEAACAGGKQEWNTAGGRASGPGHGHTFSIKVLA